MRLLIIFSFLLPQLLWGSLFSTDIDKTFKAAQKEHKPVMIDFFGIWCPPCNELDETVFETTQFLEKSKAFKLLKVDADARASWKIKDKYKVGGYPTIVFTNSSGGELYRVVGYRPLKEFLRVMDLVLGAKKDLGQSCKSSNSDDVWRCAVICSERKDLECFSVAFSKLSKTLKPGSARHDWLRTYAMENVETLDLKRAGYESLLLESPSTPQALIWASSYLAVFDDERKLKPKNELLEKVLSHYPAMLKDPKAEELGMSELDMSQIRAEILEKTGKADEAKQAWKASSQLLEKAAKELPAGTHIRGFTLDRLGCLQEAGELEAALNLANEYRGYFPEEFTFHFIAGNIFERLKRYTDALPVAKKAYEVSYGDNRIRVATLLIRLYATVPDKASAKKVFDEVNLQIKPNKDLQVRTHRYLKRMQEAWEKFPVG